MLSLQNLNSVQAEVLRAHDLEPHDGCTHCNEAVRRQAEVFGYKFKKGLLANEMIYDMGQDRAWKVCNWAQGVDWANRGGLAILGKIYQPHGHVCSIAPMPMQISPSAGEAVPMICNVGKIDGFMRASQAFVVLNNGVLIPNWKPTCFILM